MPAPNITYFEAMSPTDKIGRSQLKELKKVLSKVKCGDITDDVILRVIQAIDPGIGGDHSSLREEVLCKLKGLLTTRNSFKFGIEK